MPRNRGEMPCLNCRLIEMGEMACYQVRDIVTHLMNSEMIMPSGSMSSVQSSATLQISLETRFYTRYRHGLHL